MRVRLSFLTALALAAAAGWSAADEQDQSVDHSRSDRVRIGIEFAVRAARGDISNPNIRSLAATSAAERQATIQDTLKRLEAESARVMPSVDRLDALRTVYPHADDMSRFAADRAGLLKTIGDSCHALKEGTGLLHEAIQAQVAAGLPAFFRQGRASGDPVWLLGAYRSFEQLGRVREQVCGVTEREAAAFSQRQEELERERARRLRLLGVGGVALAAVACGFLLWRRRTLARRAWISASRS